MIIFDLDGTLWETIDATEMAAKEVARENNIYDYDISTVKKGMGLSKEENIINYYPNYKRDEAIVYLENVTLKTIGYIEKGYVKIYDGVNDVIKELSKKYKLGIVTNNNDNYAKTFLKISGLEKYFTDYMGASSYGITKEEAIRRMVERNTEKINIYVGDIKKDMEAAIGAGINFIYAKYGFGGNFEYEYYINSIIELPSFIENNFK